MRKSNSGFSLIELIMTIAIMAVLVSIIAPNLTRYLARSKKETDKKNIDEIHHQVMNCITQAGIDDIEVIVGEDGIITAEYIVERNAAARSNSVRAGVNGSAGFAELLEGVLDEATTVSKLDKRKNKISIVISGSVAQGYNSRIEFVGS
jgi:prepilin-type N-terminal cleavage/methylation domain-containing protein